MFSQTLIKGVVLDANTGEALIGASIYVPATGEGTITEFDGSFELNVKGELPIKVTISFTGYEEQEIDITDGTKN